MGVDVDRARKERRHMMWGSGLSVLLWGFLVVMIAFWPPPPGDWESPALTMLIGGIGLGAGLHVFFWAWDLPTDGSPWPAHSRGHNPAWLLMLLPVLTIMFLALPVTEAEDWKEWVLPLGWAAFVGNRTAGFVLWLATRGRPSAVVDDEDDEGDPEDDQAVEGTPVAP